MADNYLEKKMEEHRTARTVTTVRGVSRKGNLIFPFPPRRMIVAGIEEPVTHELIRQFSEHGCRVAFLSDPNLISSKKIMTDTGCRLQPTDISMPDSVCGSVDMLMKAWGDIDIMILGDRVRHTADLIDRWIENRKSLPYPNSFGGRVIMINPTNKIKLPPDAEQIGITLNHILFSGLPDAADVARISLFLSLKENKTLNYQTICFNK